MTVKETLYAQRKRIQELRNERLNAGLCIECGIEPRSHNLNGKLGVRGDACKAKLPPHKMTRPAAIPSRQGACDPEFDRELGYLETRRFAEFCVSVRGIIKKLQRPTIAEMRRGLGDNCIDHWLFDAIESLTGAGEIVEAWGLPRRWTITVESARRAKVQWNRHRGAPPPKSPRPDDESLYGDKAL